MSNIWFYLILIASGGEFALVMPEPYITESSCEKAGEVWVKGNRGRRFYCIPAPSPRQ